MARPRLIFVNRFFYPDETATSQLLTDLCIHLARQEWDVHVVTSSRQQGSAAGALRSHETLAGVTVRRVWSSNFGSGVSLLGRAIDYLSFYPTAFFALLRIAREGDLVIAKTDPPLISAAGFAAAKLKRARLLNWLQDLYPEVAVELGVRGLQGRLGGMLRWLRNVALKAADANVVIGRRMAERVRLAGVLDERIFLLPNWSQDERITPIDSFKSRARHDWGITDEEVVVCYSGNLGRAHEAETILAAAELLKDRKDIRFLFVGGGRENENLRSSISACGLKSFIFKDHQPQEALGDTLAAADIHWLSLKPELEGLIVPSKFYGIAAAGRPVIAVTSQTGEIAEVVRAADCGHVVEPGDAQGLAVVIRHLADHPISRAAMGKRARAAVDQKYSRRLALARWEWILGRLAGEDQISGPYSEPSSGGTRAH